MKRKAYKLFDKRKDGTLHALYIERDVVYPFDKWLWANIGSITEDGKVKSKIGKLAYRPGFHFTFDVPYEIHIGKKENGKIKYLPKNYVWVEIEYTDDFDYTSMTEWISRSKHNGKYVRRDACLKELPINGFYMYTTSSNAAGEWGISHGIKLIREITDDEVMKLCNEAGYIPLEREK